MFIIVILGKYLRNVLIWKVFYGIIFFFCSYVYLNMWYLLIFCIRKLRDWVACDVIILYYKLIYLFLYLIYVFKVLLLIVCLNVVKLVKMEWI